MRWSNGTVQICVVLFKIYGTSEVFKMYSPYGVFKMDSLGSHGTSSPQPKGQLKTNTSRKPTENRQCSKHMFRHTVANIQSKLAVKSQRSTQSVQNIQSKPTVRNIHFGTLSQTYSPNWLSKSNTPLRVFKTYSPNRLFKTHVSAHCHKHTAQTGCRKPTVHPECSKHMFRHPVTMCSPTGNGKRSECTVHADLQKSSRQPHHNSRGQLRQ
jgi:hypothetical protein